MKDVDLIINDGNEELSEADLEKLATEYEIKPEGGKDED